METGARLLLVPKPTAARTRCQFCLLANGGIPPCCIHTVSILFVKIQEIMGESEVLNVYASRLSAAVRYAACGGKGANSSFRTRRRGTNRLKKGGSALEKPAPLKALFFPEIAVVMIPALLPEAGFIDRAEFEGAQEFGALPEVALGHHRPQRTAVLH